MSRPVIVAYGGTIELIDEVRGLTNLSRGSLGRALVAEALRRGAPVHALVGHFADLPRPHPALTIERFSSARDLGARLKLALCSPRAAPGLAMAAAVSDYRPRSIAPGKLTSAPAERTIRLVKNPKLVDQVRGWRTGTRIVSFKLGGSSMNQDALLEAARRQRARTRSVAVVANHWPSGGVHVAWWIDDAPVRELPGRRAICRAVVDALLS